MMPQLSAPLAARLILLAKMRVAAKRDNTPIHKAADAHYDQFFLVIMAAFMRGKKALRGSLRSAGDVEGHEFHGNQYTQGGGPSKEEAQTFLQKQLDTFGGLAKGDAQLFAQSPNELYRDRLVESFKPRLGELHAALEKQYGKTITVYRAEHSKDTSTGVRSFSLSRQGAQDFIGQTYRRGTSDVVREVRISVKDVQAIGEPKHGEVLVDSKHLRSASSVPNISAAISAIRSSLLKDLPSVLAKVFVAGGNAGLSMLPKRRAAMLRTLKPQKAGEPHDTIGPYDIAFNVSDKRAVDWAEEHAGELIDGITETSRERIANAVARGLEGEDAYDDILAAVGDEARAEMIARTEIMTAANEGQRQSWVQAVEAGLLPKDAQRQWIATGDEGVCPICEALDGQTTDLDGQYPDEGENGPPAHPRCRCTEGIVA